MTVRKFRKKPVIIEAVEFKGDYLGMRAIDEWMRTGVFRSYTLQTNYVSSLTIDTLEGKMTAMPGDWIVRGVAGEFYPVKAEIFEQSYEEVEEWE